MVLHHPYFLLEIHLGLVEVLQLLLLLFEGREPLFIFQLFLLGVIESEHVPHCYVPVPSRASDCNPSPQGVRDTVQVVLKPLSALGYRELRPYCVRFSQRWLQAIHPRLSVS